MIAYKLRSSCFSEILALCVSWITYGHLYTSYMYIYVYIYIYIYYVKIEQSTSYLSYFLRKFPIALDNFSDFNVAYNVAALDL